jgi:hypothetical protein
LTIDTSQNVGIGTTSPTRRLSLDNGASTQVWTGYQQAGTEKFVVGLDASGNPTVGGTQSAPLIFKTVDVERARITSSGNFGIGNTSPSAQLQVGTGAEAGAGTGTGQICVTGAGSTLAVPGKPAVYHRTAVGLGLYSDYAMSFEVNGSTSKIEAARIDQNGKFLIGTTSGGGELSFKDVTGLKIQFNASADNFYGISKLAGGGTLGDGEYRFTSGNTSAGAFTFSSGGSERVRITSGGNFGIGTSTPQYRLSLGNATGRKLAVYDDGSSGGVASGFGVDLSGSGYELSAWSGAPGGGNGIFTFGQVNTTNGAFTERLRVNTGGQLTLPYQPAFMATTQAITFTPGTGTYIYGAVKLNRGSHYNSGSGRFTAPVAGVYYFCHQTSGRPTSSTTYEPKIYVNGNEVSRVFANGAGYGPNGTTTLTISLAANDYVEAGFYNGAAPAVVLSGSDDINPSGNGIVTGFMGWLLG